MIIVKKMYFFLINKKSKLNQYHINEKKTIEMITKIKIKNPNKQRQYKKTKK